MGRYDEFYKAKDFIIGMLKTELIGPVKPDETLESPPLNTYVSGILWPSSFRDHKKTEEENDYELYSQLTDVIESSSEDETSVSNETPFEENDVSISKTSVRKPSTMAITAMIGIEVKSVLVRFTFGKYIHSEETRDMGEDKNPMVVHLYTRKEYIAEFVMDFSRDALVYHAPYNKILNDFNIQIQANKRLGRLGENRLVSFSVTNLLMAQKKDIVQNEGALFQCELELIPQEGHFVPLKTEYFGDVGIEDEILAMHYRNSYTFAQGHGCATSCDTKNDICTDIKSEFIPVYEFKQMKSRPSDSKIFSLKYLYEGDRKSIIADLYGFVNEYTEWAEGQREDSKGDEFSQYNNAVNSCLSKIEICINRIGNGIKILEQDDVAWKAFTLCNEAMYQQRVGMSLIKGKIKERGEFATKVDDPTWYPFQLFYLIMIIPDFVDEGEFRDVVDLLWFPTGGGKTEAYLGVSAFIIFYERLKNVRIEYGTTIIMRYTLRLLTVQQFERATALICACENIRKEHKLGGNEISIGLWIGIDSAPNKVDKAKENLEKLMDGQRVYKSNPVQLTHCPYCGKELDAINYSIENDEMIISCECVGRLPVYIVDSDIYKRKPTLVISTVDKFARIVWEKKAGNLFGCNCGKVNKPKLIIQDELHLISGPLGTLTGLYESAIDRLCWDGDSKPKIIASTATIKNAAYQVKGLYNREYFQFPPSGLNINDSFFAVEASSDDRPCRYYVGTAEQGGSPTDLVVRVFSSLCLADYYLSKNKTVPKEVIDQYYTIIGYFNAIKDLGSVSTTLKERMYQTVNAMLNGKFVDYSKKYNIEQTDSGHYKNPEGLRSDELTSRKSSTEIRQTLDDLDKPYYDKDSYPLKYVLSTNMFSVGVDIDRLGIMAMFCQPKTNAEYIQATSRVGRTNPGIVISMYHASRSRDRSYYEQFYQYHNSFYRYVEPTSVTPFSDRSIEKGLHSVFIALVRHLVPGMADNDSAKKFNTLNANVKEIREFLLSRVKSVQPNNYETATEYLDDFMKEWQYKCVQNLVYDKSRVGRQDRDETVALLESAETAHGDFSILNSVRNVENGADVYVNFGDIKDDKKEIK